MGPYIAGDVVTEGVNPRKICSVPHSIVGLFATKPGGITYQHYFLVVYSMIAGDRRHITLSPVYSRS